MNKCKHIARLRMLREQITRESDRLTLADREREATLVIGVVKQLKRPEQARLGFPSIA